MNHQFDDIEKTFVAPVNDGIDFSGNLLVIFDDSAPPRTVNLSDYEKGGELIITREHTADFSETQNRFSRQQNVSPAIVVSSRLVSRKGSIRFVKKDQYWKVTDDQGRLQRGDKRLDGAEDLLGADLLRITNGNNPDDVFLMISYSSIGGSDWKYAELPKSGMFRLGRDEDMSDVCLPDINVSRHHACIFYNADRDAYIIRSESEKNGTFVNGKRITGETMLRNKDVIQIGKTHFVLVRSGNVSTIGLPSDGPAARQKDRLYYYTFGNSIEAVNVVVRRGNLLKGVATRTNHVSMEVRGGELVAIVGGSGAGKSTLLNCMCGYLKPAEGHVLINGVDLYEKYNDLRHLIGYVPQSDIVYDQLTVEQMLRFSAKLRLPETIPNAKKKDIDVVINRTLSIVEMTHKRNAKIGELSGGQRKRASIAVELLSNPDILFLDEPTSGLDPETERGLMVSLRKMADSGKAVILVTHSTLQLQMCDKVAFVGPGGFLKFYGPLEDAYRHFNTNDVVDIFGMIEKKGRDVRPAQEETAYGRSGRTEDVSTRKLFGHHRVNRLRQLPVLIARNFALMFSSAPQTLATLLSYALPALIVLLIFPQLVSTEDSYILENARYNVEVRELMSDEKDADGNVLKKGITSVSDELADLQKELKDLSEEQQDAAMEGRDAGLGGKIEQKQSDISDLQDKLDGMTKRKTDAESKMKPAGAKFVPDDQFLHGLLLYLLSCTIAFLVTLLSSTQICKESTVLHREKMAGESITIYYLAKLFCLTLLDLLASAMTWGAFMIYRIPEGVTGEFFCTIFLIYFSFTCLGLLVSAVVKKPDATSTVTAMILISQLLMSGILMKVGPVLDFFKRFIVCYHSTMAFGMSIQADPRMFAAPDRFSPALTEEWLWILGISAAAAVLTPIWLNLSMRCEVSKKEDRPGLLKRK